MAIRRPVAKIAPFGAPLVAPAPPGATGATLVIASPSGHRARARTTRQFLIRISHRPERLPTKLGGMTKPAQPQLIEIFRAGKHTDMHGRVREYSDADIQAIADAYDPNLGSAAVVVGHPKLDAPAYGWVDKVVAKDGVLLVSEDQVDPAFAEMRKNGRFKNRSASFFLPDAPNNPKPGQLYLKHVGWLGAAAPAVPGLKPVQFAADDQDVVEFAFNDRRWGFRMAGDALRRLRDWLIDKEGLEKANEVLPDYIVNSVNEAAEPDRDSDAVRSFSEHDNTEDTNVTQATADLAAREARLKEREDAVAANENAQREAAATARRNDAVAFADGLVKEGKLLPKNKATTVELLLALPTEAPLSFGEGDDKVEKPAAELFRDLLSGLPKQIDFSERAGGDIDAGATTEFSAPAGTAINADALEIHNKALAYQAQHQGVTYLAAVKAVGG